MMKISTWHEENLDLLWWKSLPVMRKISTCHDENLPRSSWKCQPAMMKISTVRNKLSTVRHENKFQCLAEMAFDTQWFHPIKTLFFSNIILWQMNCCVLKSGQFLLTFRYTIHKPYFFLYLLVRRVFLTHV